MRGRRHAVIDLHVHALPGVDDGPGTLQEALALARAAAAEGVELVAATPHVRFDHPRVRPPELADRTRALGKAIDAAGVSLSVVSGGEVDLLWAMEAEDEELVQVSYAGRGHDLLVETPYESLTPDFEDHLFKIAVRGFRLLLAHPERNPSLRRHPRRLAEIVARGTLVQVTADALAGPRRSPSRRFALACVREGLAHVIASDSHGAAVRRVGLRAGVEAAARVAPARALWMVQDAPAAVLAGEPLPPMPHRPWWRPGRRRLG